MGKSSLTTRADLGMCLGNLGRLRLMQQEWSLAEAQLERGLTEMTHALKAQPQHASYRQAAFNQCADLAQALIGKASSSGR